MKADNYTVQLIDLESNFDLATIELMVHQNFMLQVSPTVLTEWSTNITIQQVPRGVQTDLFLCQIGDSAYHVFNSHYSG
jgi:hypothetical protein